MASSPSRQLFTTLAAIWPIAIDSNTSMQFYSEHGQTLDEFTREVQGPPKDGVSNTALEAVGS